LAILVTLATAPAAEATPKPSGSAGKRPLNALADATRPNLLLHAHNQVDWHPWGLEAFALAREPVDRGPGTQRNPLPASFGPHSYTGIEFKPMKRVLFLCTGNSCRSQMAEGWLKHIGGNGYDVFSAGTHPTTVNLLAIRAMGEVDVDISNQTPDGIDIYRSEHFDLVVSVCDNAKESCPLFTNADEILHWGFDDPADARGTDEERMREFRRVRDEIRTRISDYLSEGSG
tara:strand:- start:79 stop:768 length:690 start_codon:yes stop_codon:yes gene_type:complete